jgi:hypothetical protein
MQLSILTHVLCAASVFALPAQEGLHQKRDGQDTSVPPIPANNIQPLTSGHDTGITINWAGLAMVIQIFPLPILFFWSRTLGESGARLQYRWIFPTNISNSTPHQEEMTGSHQNWETSPYQSQAPRNQQARAITPRGSRWALPLRSPFYKLALWPTHTSPPMVVSVLVITASMSGFRHPQNLSTCLNSLSQRVTAFKFS